MCETQQAVIDAALTIARFILFVFGLACYNVDESIRFPGNGARAVKALQDLLAVDPNDLYFAH